MGRKFLSSCLTLLVLLGAGCSKSDDSSGRSVFYPTSTPDNSVHYVTGTDSDKMIAAANVFCMASDPTACSPSVGMLVARIDDNQVAECTTFLVGPDVVMTNSHCLPDELKVSGSACVGHMVAKFPTVTGYAGEEFDCSQVLVASTLSEKTKSVPDYAVLKLTKASSRPPLVLNRAGFSDHGTYKIFKVNPVGDGEQISGGLDSANCTAVHNSMMVPNSGSDSSMNMMIADCTVIHGNSGSPLVDSNNQVHGVIQMTIDKEKLDTLLLTTKFKQTDHAMSPIGGGTNFACLQLPKEVKGPAISSECSSVLAKVGTTADAKSPDELRLEKQLNDDMKKNASPVTRSFQWDAIQYKDSQSFIPIPRCTIDSSALIKGHKPTDISGEVIFKVPMIDISIEINRYFVPTIQLIESISVVSIALDYNPKDLLDKKSTDATIYETKTSKSKDQLKSISLGMCKN